MTDDRNPPIESSRLARAFAYAADLHKDQVRKGSDTPYISHLMAVASLVQENGGDEDQVIAALLHDGPEDQGGTETLEEIEGRFGKRVAEIVEDLSDTFETPKPAWKPRKLAYLEHLESVSEDSLLVSLADKVHNLGSIVRDLRAEGDEVWSRFNTGRDGTVWYYKQLLAAYRSRSAPQCQRLLSQFELLHEELAGLEQGVADPEDS